MDQPSPLAGEGGERRSPGEGGYPLKRKSPLRRFNEPNTRRSKRMRNVARTLRGEMTEAERKLWVLLRDHRLTGFKFRRQVAIGPYVADFTCFQSQLIIEADGGQHASSPSDIERDSWLAAQGYRVLRFWNSDILNNPEGVLSQIAAHRP